MNVAPCCKAFHEFLSGSYQSNFSYHNISSLSYHLISTREARVLGVEASTRVRQSSNDHESSTTRPESSCCCCSIDIKGKEEEEEELLDLLPTNFLNYLSGLQKECNVIEKLKQFTNTKQAFELKVRPETLTRPH